MQKNRYGLFVGDRLLEMQDSEFRFNGCSSLEFNLYLKQYPNIPKIKEDIEYKKVEGRDSAYQIKSGTYEDRIIKLKVALARQPINQNLIYPQSADYFWQNVEIIEEWLTGEIINNKLFIGRNDKFFKVRDIEIGDIAKSLQTYGEFEIKLRVEPFMYNSHLEDCVYMVDSKPFTFDYIGDFATKPKITIYGNGTVSATINNATITVKNVVDVVTIDTQLFIAYDEYGRSKNIDVYGEYPIIEKGKNIITYSGDVDNIHLHFYNLFR